MPTATLDYTTDTWDLSVDPYGFTAAHHYDTVTAPFAVTGVLDYVVGDGYAGIYMASARVLDQRDFSALVAAPNAQVYVVHGTMADNGTDVTVLTASFTPVAQSLLASFPNSMSYSGGSWSYTYLGDQQDTVADSFVSVPDVAGTILFRLTGTSATDTLQARIGTLRTMSGTITFPGQGTNDVAITAVEDDEFGAVEVTSEARIHAIVGAPYGDLEVDIGKSVPWTHLFADDTFITDINLGNPRYWVVDWDKTSPTSKFVSLGINYFTDQVGWRVAQFQAADAAWNYHDDDWVLFVDGSEAMSCDTRSQPDDVATTPFRSFIHREVARAEAAGKTQVSIPFYAYVRQAEQPDARRFVDLHDPAQVAQDLLGTPYSVTDVNTMAMPVAVPYYYQRNLSGNGSGLVRLVKVSTLRTGFDWSLVDTLSEPSADVKVQLISYAYAKWVNPVTGEDDGLKMRQLISQVRPLLGLPANGVGDASGTAGPYLAGVDGQITQIDGTGTSAPLLTPMYTSYFRYHPQDGVWYLPNAVAQDPPPPPYAYPMPPPSASAVSFDAEVLVS